MEFVENEKRQVPSMLNQPSFLDPRHDQFEHDVVGEQDVRRMLEDTFSFLLAFLPGVPSETTSGSWPWNPRDKNLSSSSRWLFAKAFIG